MELVEQMHGAVKVATVSGRIDQTTAAQFQNLLAPLLVKAKAGAAPLLLDFSGVDYISSVGLRALMLTAREARAAGCGLAVAGLQPLVQEIFQISRFDMVVSLYPTPDAALEALSSAAAAAHRAAGGTARG